MALCHRAARAASDAVFLVDADCLPQTVAVVRTRAVPLGIDVVVADLAAGLPDTGGRAVFPLEAKDLTGVYGEIKVELSSQYSMAYESNNLRRDGQFRRVAVRVDRTGVVARTRPGYYASLK